MGVVDGTFCEIERLCDSFAQWVFADGKHKTFSLKYKGGPVFLFTKRVYFI
jgi:hypothetical protein